MKEELSAAEKIDNAIQKRKESLTFFSIIVITYKMFIRFLRQVFRLETIQKLNNITTEQLTQKENVPTENSRKYDDY